MKQLPNDALSQGYRLVKPFHYEQVFSSKSANFTGTENEFIANGNGYEYIQLDKFTRRVIK